MLLPLALCALGGYLLGSIPTGYLLGRMRGVDVRQFGSGATGGTNVLRTLGWGPAVTTALVDVAKGSLATWLGLLWIGPWGATVAGCAAMVGHSYPAWIGWRGGKAVGTGFGSLAVQNPAGAGLALALALAVVIPTRYVSLGSVVGALAAVVYIFARGIAAEQVFSVLAAVIVVWRHRENIARLRAGTENKFGQKGQPRRSG